MIEAPKTFQLNRRLPFTNAEWITRYSSIGAIRSKRTQPWEDWPAIQTKRPGGDSQRPVVNDNVYRSLFRLRSNPPIKLAISLASS
jgi:hypothetical protein